MSSELIRDGKLDRQATAEALRQFLENIVGASGLELKVNVRAVSGDGSPAEGEAEVVADLDGRDKEMLLERGADVLKAFEHLAFKALRSEEHTSELQSQSNLVCRLLLEKKKTDILFSLIVLLSSWMHIIRSSTTEYYLQSFTHKLFFIIVLHVSNTVTCFCMFVHTCGVR